MGDIYKIFHIAYIYCFKAFLSFQSLLSKCSNGNLDKIKVGLEATGHYSTNLLSFLKQLGVSVTLFNPLSVSQSRRACSLRRTKTDINDARYIAQLLVSDRSSPYHEQLYHISSLKSLTRTRFRLRASTSKKSLQKVCLHPFP